MSLLDERLFAAACRAPIRLAPKPPHFAPKAKSVIYLFMARRAVAGRPLRRQAQAPPVRRPGHPRGVRQGRAFRLHQGDAQAPGLAVSRSRRAAGPRRRSRTCCRTPSEIADDIAIVRSLSTTQFNHAPAQIFMNSGHQIVGRPSIGSWVTYGLGDRVDRTCPASSSCSRARTSPTEAKSCWGSGFLPTGLPGRRVPLEGRSRPVPAPTPTA